MRDCAISHEPLIDLKAIRWSEMNAESLRSLLASLDGIEEQVFAARGVACLLIEERILWQPLGYPSFDVCLKAICPKSWGYCRDAMRTVKELREMPLADLLQIPRVNLQTMKQLSTGVRNQPEVIEAAKTMSETEFAAKVSNDYHQHIEATVTFRLKYPSGDAAIIMKALGIVGERLDVQDMAGQLLGWAIDFLRILWRGS
jgi:hypothetical protein